jgi:hypothetical protein
VPRKPDVVTKMVLAIVTGFDVLLQVGAVIHYVSSFSNVGWKGFQLLT